MLFEGKANKESHQTQKLYTQETIEISSEPKEHFERKTIELKNQ